MHIPLQRVEAAAEEACALQEDDLPEGQRGPDHSQRFPITSLKSESKSPFVARKRWKRTDAKHSAKLETVSRQLASQQSWSRNYLELFALANALTKHPLVGP